MGDVIVFPKVYIIETNVVNFGISIPARSHTFMEIDHEIISSVILFPCEGLLSVTRESMCTKYWLSAC